jgi:predicted DNA-binding transcriptional regulator YafY
VKNPPTTQAERMALLAWRIAHGEAVRRADVEREFNVSRATAKRDLALLRGLLPAHRKPSPGARLVALLSGRLE